MWSHTTYYMMWSQVNNAMYNNSNKDITLKAKFIKFCIWLTIMMWSLVYRSDGCAPDDIRLHLHKVRLISPAPCKNSINSMWSLQWWNELICNNYSRWSQVTWSKVSLHDVNSGELLVKTWIIWCEVCTGKMNWSVIHKVMAGNDMKWN